MYKFVIGRLLHIIYSRKKKTEEPKEDTTAQKNEPKLSSYQQKLEKDRKKLLSKLEGWNSSFVRNDTAVEAIANR